jgi:hypothetical protein
MQTSPVVGLRLLNRLAQQSSRVAVQRAIAHLPRVEDRLLALFLHLAERWGRVGNGGVILPVSLTHATLGRLVGARRPTVSLALKELTSEGLVARRDDGAWVVSHASRTTLAALAQPPAPPPKLTILASAPVHTVRREHGRIEVSVAEGPIARLLD